jgi:hypothetical protein
MQDDTTRVRKFAGSNAPRAAWRGWAGPVSASVIDRDLATMLDRSDDPECGLRNPGRWRRHRW